MEYDRVFIFAVSCVQSEFGSDDAQRVFEKLFARAGLVSPYQPDINRLFGSPISIDVIKSVSADIGKPGQIDNAVPWIKEFRARTGCGLKVSKDIHDYAKSHPAIHD
jgi:hypothetical protein